MWQKQTPRSIKIVSTSEKNKIQKSKRIYFLTIDSNYIYYQIIDNYLINKEKIVSSIEFFAERGEMFLGCWFSSIKNNKKVNFPVEKFVLELDNPEIRQTKIEKIWGLRLLSININSRIYNILVFICKSVVTWSLQWPQKVKFIHVNILQKKLWKNRVTFFSYKQTIDFDSH